MNQPYMYGDINGWNTTVNKDCQKKYTHKKTEIYDKTNQIVDSEFLRNKLNNNIQSNILEYEKGMRHHKEVDTSFNTKCKFTPEQLNSIISTEITELYDTDRSKSLYNQDSRREDKYGAINSTLTKINTTHQCNFTQAQWEHIISQTTNDIYLNTHKKYSHKNTCLDGFDTLIQEESYNSGLDFEHTPAYLKKADYDTYIQTIDEQYIQPETYVNTNQENFKYNDNKRDTVHILDKQHQSIKPIQTDTLQQAILDTTNDMIREEFNVIVKPTIDHNTQNMQTIERDGIHREEVNTQLRTNEKYGNKTSNIRTNKKTSVEELFATPEIAKTQRKDNSREMIKNKQNYVSNTSTQRLTDRYVNDRVHKNMYTKGKQMDVTNHLRH